MEKEAELAYLHWLHCVEGIGRKTLLVLSAYAGNAEDVYRLPERELKWLLTRKQLDNLLLSRKTWRVEEEYENLRRQGITFIPYQHREYPEKFRDLPDPPASVYVRGRLPEAAVCTVAVIGTRSCTGYGTAMAKQLGKALAAAGVQVVSGMARGIDGIGQRAVTAAGGSTFAVLGCGVDICYPPENRLLYNHILERGGILSEYPPGTPPRAALFPPRNRLISGLSDAVVVVEAREQSGTMITVDMALEQGREVYAIPGRLVDQQSGGCNRLLKQGAGMLLSIEEFLEELGAASTEDRHIPAENPPSAPVPARVSGGKPVEKGGSLPSLSLEEETVYNCLDYEAKSLAVLSEDCPGIPISHLSAVLVSLCLRNRAEQIGVGYYCLK